MDSLSVAERMELELAQEVLTGIEADPTLMFRRIPIEHFTREEVEKMLWMSIEKERAAWESADTWQRVATGRPGAGDVSRGAGDEWRDG